MEFKDDLFIYVSNVKIDKTGENRVKKDVKEIHADFDKLTELRDSSRHYKEILTDAIPAAEQVLKNVDQLAQRAEQPVDKSRVKPDYLQLESSIENLKEIAKSHADALPTDPDAAKLHDRMVQQFLAWLLAANILICPLIVLYFSQNVVRRLLVLVSNAERLAHDKELLEPVGGNDEIAHLDNVFRLMAATIRTTRAEREEAERLKKDFIAMIGHDLRTPLSSVQGTLTLLADGIYGDISEIGINKAKAAEKSIERITHLANELLEIEKIESNNLHIEMETISLQTAIQRSIANLDGFALYKNISIESSHNDFEVMADEERLTQVLVNLLSNALKFSPDGSTITITSGRTVDGQVEVRICDQGRGISEDQKEKIFAPYKQLDRSDAQNEKGIGLGLAICKAIVENHGGRIGVDKNSDKGCSFWFTLAPALQQKIQLETRERDVRRVQVS